MIVGLSGYAGSGKDEVAKILINSYNYKRVAFSDKIREVLYATNPVVMVDVAFKDITIQDLVLKEGWDNAKKNKEVRRLLQALGESCRTYLDDNLWVTSALSNISDEDNVVITDVRYLNEVEHLKQKFPSFQLWRVKRPDVYAVNNHISEVNLDGYRADQILYNNGSLDDLSMLIKTRMRGSLK